MDGLVNGYSVIRVIRIDVVVDGSVITWSCGKHCDVDGCGDIVKLRVDGVGSGIYEQRVRGVCVGECGIDDGQSVCGRADVIEDRRGPFISEWSDVIVYF